MLAKNAMDLSGGVVNFFIFLIKYRITSILLMDILETKKILMAGWKSLENLAKF
jgi:hypothetical protein